MASRRRAERAACMAPVSSSAALQQGDASETAWKGNADPKQSSDGAYYAALNRQAHSTLRGSSTGKYYRSLAHLDMALMRVEVYLSP